MGRGSKGNGEGVKEVWEDVWIPSACSICYNQCGILVHRVNGVAVKIEGNPDSPLGLGRLCPKGLSGIMMLYDPHRLNAPLKRTNPQKGIGVDPGWVEISWEEALETIAGRLNKVREDDPRKLIMTGCIPSMWPLTFGMSSFMPAFGSFNIFISDGHQCGNAEHLLAGTLHAALTTNPDLEYCNYLIMFGCHCGTAAYYAFTTMAQRMADARARGMKLVVVDPMMNAAGEKADEWLPIKPGTDGALALAMLNVLLNEENLYDKEYLREHTNGPYLIKPDGYYLRCEATGAPLTWDEAREETAPYNQTPPHQAAIEGRYQVDGVECRPAFQVLKEHVEKYTPEWAEGVTTLPAKVILRIAREFGQAASIGSTITVDGVQLPHRPASVVYFKGAHGHNHAWLTSLAIELVCEVVGASNVPGGFMGCNPVCYGHPETELPRWVPEAGPDGLLTPGVWYGVTEPGFSTKPYPAPEPQAPQSYSFMDLLPLALSSHLAVMTVAMKEDFKIPYKPEVLINYGANSLMSIGDPAVTAEALKELYVISFNLWLDETTDFADIVLPDTSYLERLDPSPNLHIHHFPVGMGDWGWQIRQPVVAPMGQRRHFCEVLLDISERLGMLPDHYAILNHYYGLRGEYTLKPTETYSWEEIGDRIYKNFFGPEHGLEWFKEHGVIKWPKQVREAFWKPFIEARVPIYFEWMKDFAKKIDAIVEENGLPWPDTGDFQPLPDWKPCAALEAEDQEYDMQAIYYRVAWHSFSMTYQNPWLDEISTKMDPYSYFVSLNAATAKKKGIRSGDPLWVESKEAGRVRGRAVLVEGIHPQVVGIANNGGHWSPNLPVAKGKGVFFEALMPLDLDKTDPVTITMDCDARVKIYKDHSGEKWQDTAWSST
jgi:molybdopterin-containing oxidoreductase family molybdopterin binding subunit